MKKIAWCTVLFVALLLVVPASDGWVRSGVFVGVGPGWWGPPWWYYPRAYYYPPTYVYTPPVIAEQPPVYVQPQPAPPAPPSESYWYYCPDTRAYYPNVETCAGAWIKVPPRR